MIFGSFWWHDPDSCHHVQLLLGLWCVHSRMSLCGEWVVLGPFIWWLASFSLVFVGLFCGFLGLSGFWGPLGGLPDFTVCVNSL